jgi:hypothetical protein
MARLVTFRSSLYRRGALHAAFRACTASRDTQADDVAQAQQHEERSTSSFTSWSNAHCSIRRGLERSCPNLLEAANEAQHYANQEAAG